MLFLTSNGRPWTKASVTVWRSYKRGETRSGNDIRLDATGALTQFRDIARRRD